MDRVAAGDCTYVPTQLYPTQRTDSPQSLSLLALRRLRLMSATEHSNTTLGKIYIGNCVEPMQWAGEHVGYVIDASDGRSNVNAIVQKPFPRGWWPCPLCGSFWCPCPLLSYVLFCIYCRLLLCLMSSGITHGTEIAFASGCGSAGVGGKVPRARGGIAWRMPSRWSSSLSFSAPLSSFTVGRGSTGAAPSAASCSVSSRVATSTWR